MTTKRNIYLTMKPLAEARKLFLDHFDWASILDTEEIIAADTAGRITAAPLFARFSAPSYHCAAMDGFALKAADTYGANERAPVELTLDKGAFPVNTGDPLPSATNAVVMIEAVTVVQNASIRLEEPVFPWQHVRSVGEDIVATEMLFPRHHRISPYSIGALLAGGITSVPVLCRPRVLIIPTGGEMLDPAEVAPEGPPRGRIIESNSALLAALVAEAGGQAERHPVVSDEIETIATLLRDVAHAKSKDDALPRADLILVIGGSSAGSHDYTRAAIAKAGEVLIHGVPIMPGKPTLLGALDQIPVVGIPGYPVSAIVAFEEFVAPALARMQGILPRRRPRLTARPTRKIASKLGMEELVRVRLGRIGEHFVASPLPRGAGVITSLTRADGIIRIPGNLEGIHPSRPVEVELLHPEREIERNIVVVGSHDLALDIIADLLRVDHPGIALASSHVGSLGGLIAIGKGLCHIAGTHLLDPEDGSYNIADIRRHLPNLPLDLVHLVEREQGLIVAPGNPLGILSTEDLTRGEIRFCNRQGGSGTRVLLDHLLHQADISTGQIRGYEREEFTHMAVAVAVASGAADAGLGIRAAANALALDFIPITSENYDLVIPRSSRALPGPALLLQLIATPEFRRRIEALGGYSAARSGEVIYSTPGA
jgi:putative molybdopterin biosynthesis protein